MVDKGTLAFALLVGILPMAVILSGSPLINNLSFLGVYPGEQITTTFMTTEATAVAYSTGTALVATTEVNVLSIPTTIMNTQVLLVTQVTTQGGVVTTQTQVTTQALTTTQVVTTQTSSTAMVTGQTTYSSSTTVTAQTTVSTFVPAGWSCPSGYICTGTVGGVYYACPSGQILTAGGCTNYYGGTGSGGSGLANPPTGGGPSCNTCGSDRWTGGSFSIFGMQFDVAPLVLTGTTGQEVLVSPLAQVIFFVVFPLIGLLLYLRKRR